MITTVIRLSCRYGLLALAAFVWFFIGERAGLSLEWYHALAFGFAATFLLDLFWPPKHLRVEKHHE